jgi:predicted AlkP superfamily phosphohydrolase/phosphomutase
MLDDALGRVLARLTDDDVLFVASDHGFVGATNWIFINEYLRQHNLLSYGSPMATSRAKLVGYTREAARKLGILNLMRQGRKRYRRALGDEIVPKSQPEYYPSVRGVDWQHTRACVPSASAFGAGYADVFMNADATEADMEELRQALAAERHPETGEPLADAIYATDAFGIGPFRPPEEHLILAARTGMAFHLGIGRPSLWGPLDKIMGVHEKEGVFYAWGAGIRRGAQIDPLQIYDLVPTALQALGISVDEPFDGRVAQEVFAAETPAGDARHEDSLVVRKLKRLQSGAHPMP